MLEIIGFESVAKGESGLFLIMTDEEEDDDDDKL